MRILVVVIALGVTATVDNLWLDSRYSHAVWQEASYQGQQLSNQLNSIVEKIVGR
jgi:hypothetical protein